MSHLRHLLRAIVATSVVAVAACSDAPSAPQAAPASRSPIAAFAKGGIPGRNGAAGSSSSDPMVDYLATLHDTVSREVGPMVGLQRVAPITSTVSASATIGSDGGMLELPDAGAYLWVPPGAVSARTTFRITANPGKAAAYDFEPAGAVFSIPLVLIQDKAFLSTKVPAGFTGAALGYFANNADVDPATANAVGSQLRAPLAFSTEQYLAFPVWHFSGYIVCWGRAESR